MQKKAMCLMLIIILSTNFNIYAKSKPSKDTPGTAIFVMATPNNSDEIIINTKEISSELEEISLNIHIPQIQGLPDKNFQKELNQTFMNEAKKAKKNALTIARDYNKDMLKDGLNPIKFEYISNFSIVKAPAPYLVLAFLEYQYSGGAHGISYQKYITLNTKDSTIVTLKSLFKEDVDYKQLINTQIQKQIQERSTQGEYFFPGQEGFVGIKDDQAFYINRSGDLVIVFNIYEIAPYAAGIIEFIIPNEQIAQSLK